MELTGEYRKCLRNRSVNFLGTEGFADVYLSENKGYKIDNNNDNNNFIFVQNSTIENQN